MTNRCIWPVVNPAGRTIFLSSGQRTLLLYVRGQMARGRHRFTLVQLSRVSGIDVSNVSRGLDRLASFHLVGRRSTRGRNGQTITWRVRARTSGALRFTRNVATTTSIDGYLTPERWRSNAAGGEREAVRRLTPPRSLYGRCAAGHKTRLTRWRWSRSPGTTRDELRSFEGVWRGACRRCGDAVELPLQVTIRDGGRVSSGQWERAGTVARRLRPYRAAGGG